MKRKLESKMWKIKGAETDSWKSFKGVLLPKMGTRNNKADIKFILRFYSELALLSQ